MGLFSFIKDAGEKLFGSAQAATPAAAPAAAPASPSVEDLNARAAAAIAAYIEKQNLGIEGLKVAFDGATSTVTLQGRAPSAEAAEKASLAAGNVAHVGNVDNQIEAPADAATRYHDVVRGDTLSAIAKKYYGDANKYPVIFEANRPMLTHPDKIYPGQKLRIPAI